jgi:hypothetical protein
VKINLLAKIIYVLSIYTSPTGNLMHFINDTDTILNHIHKSNIEVIMCWQLNVNYLAHNCNKRQQLENLVATYNLISAVQFATRIISRTNSAVDNNTFVDISHIRKYATSFHKGSVWSWHPNNKATEHTYSKQIKWN